MVNGDLRFDYRLQIVGDSSQAVSLLEFLHSLFSDAFVLFVENYGTGTDRCS